MTSELTYRQQKEAAKNKLLKLVEEEQTTLGEFGSFQRSQWILIYITKKTFDHKKNVGKVHWNFPYSRDRKNHTHEVELEKLPHMDFDALEFETYALVQTDEYRKANASKSSWIWSKIEPLSVNEVEALVKLTGIRTISDTDPLASI
jgi:hypothetical protein